LSIRTKLRIYTIFAALILLVGMVLIFLPGESSTLRPIGTSLVASGIVIVLDIIYKNIVEEHRESLDALLASGLEAIYNRRDLDKYHVLMASLSSRLDIAGYSLRNFYESFRQILLDRLHDHPSLQVRILVVDPGCTHSAAREKIERLVPGTFQKNIEQLKEALRDHPTVTIRTLQADLTTMVFRIDTTMFVGPQFQSAPSKSAVTLEIKEARDAWLFRAYEREFDHLWSKASGIYFGRRNRCRFWTLCAIPSI